MKSEIDGSTVLTERRLRTNFGRSIIRESSDMTGQAASLRFVAAAVQERMARSYQLRDLAVGFPGQWATAVAESEERWRIPPDPRSGSWLAAAPMPVRCLSRD
jgi:hypothetical protein